MGPLLRLLGLLSDIAATQTGGLNGADAPAPTPEGTTETTGRATPTEVSPFAFEPAGLLIET
jgi:hypothetical protein